MRAGTPAGLVPVQAGATAGRAPRLPVAVLRGVDVLPSQHGTERRSASPSKPTARGTRADCERSRRACPTAGSRCSSTRTPVGGAQCDRDAESGSAACARSSAGTCREMPRRSRPARQRSASEPSTRSRSRTAGAAPGPPCRSGGRAPNRRCRRAGAVMHLVAQAPDRREGRVRSVPAREGECRNYQPPGVARNHPEAVPSIQRCASIQCSGRSSGTTGADHCPTRRESRSPSSASRASAGRLAPARSLRSPASPGRSGTSSPIRSTVFHGAPSFAG